MDFVTELGTLALATRLKRLSERLGQDVSRVYKELNLDFESKWFLVLALLKKEGALSIVEISDALKLSHPAIVQFADQMLSRGLIESVQDPRDARRRMISLSNEGNKLYDKLSPILEVIKQENQNWLSEAGADLLATIAALERSLDERSMYERIKIGGGVRYEV